MSATRYTFDSVRSRVWVRGRSSLAPINTETRGMNGWFVATVRPDGSLDLDSPVAGHLELASERLTSGNVLYDRELRRRIDSKRCPSIVGDITRVEESEESEDHSSYLVTGDVSFHGKTRTFSHEMRIEVHGEEVVLTGQDLFDVREFGLNPPSMLMIRVYPEINVRVELYGALDG
jgi:polyisoprenoid-binding protein YceI